MLFQYCTLLNDSLHPSAVKTLLYHKQYAQVSLFMAPPRSWTVCGTVWSSPASVRTAFL